MAQLQKFLELEFTILEFFQEYVVSTPREGEVLEKKQIEDLVEVCSDYYKGSNFVYISFRVNDYNVSPTIYLDLDKVKNLKGIAVVSNKPTSLNMARFEKNFSKVPFEIFKELEPAKQWAQKTLEKKKADL